MSEIDTKSADESTRGGAAGGRRSRWWIAAAAVAVVLLLGAAVGATVALVDDDDDGVARRVTGSSSTQNLAGDIISRERAARIAREAVGGGTVTELELDDENGVLVYEAEVRDDTDPTIDRDVVIDARTGDVLALDD